MKLYKIFILAMIVGGATALSSCNDFLQEKPEALVSPGDVENSKDGINQWVTGVYSNWLYDIFCWGEFPRVLELDADYISGPSWLFSYLGAGNFQAESSLNKMWNGPYNLINDANVAERNIAQMNGVDEAFKNNALGEIYFQKAFCYFLLVRAYGPVPYMAADISTSGEFNNSRRPVAEIYQHIISLLTKAANMMYTRENSNYQAGHVCAGSAAGMLAKVYATMASAAMPQGTEIDVRTGAPYEKVNGVQIYRAPSTETFKKNVVEGYEDMDPMALYQEAAKWARKVIDGEYGIYQLSPYATLWKHSNIHASEMMWGIECVAGNDTYKTNIHTNYSGMIESEGSNLIEQGKWVGCTNNWYSLFDEQDYRVTKGVAHVWRYYYQKKYNGAFYYPQSWSVKVTGYDTEGNYVREPDKLYADMGYDFQYNQSNECLAFTTKYDDVANDAIQNTESYWPFLRFADVLLIYAEASNELGNGEEAMRYLNMVRQRSNATLMTRFISKQSLRSSIIEERAKEFACEGDRRWDLLRWGIYLQAMNAIGGYDDAGVSKNRTKRNLLYPIPTAEINVNDSISENNYGWN